MTALAIREHLAPATIRVPTRRHALDALLEGLNPNTLRAYSGDIRHFAAHVGIEDPRRAVDALLSLARGEANAVVLGYRAAMLDGGLSGATVGRRLTAVRKVVRIARTIGQVDWTLDVPSPRAEALRDTRGPGEEGWRAMVREVRRKADEGDAVAVRNLAILRLAHDLGLRRGEICGLDHEDVDQRAGTVAVAGKGKTQKRAMTLPEKSIDALTDWLAVRGPGSGPLFHRLDNAGTGEITRMSGEAIRKLVRDLGVKADVGRPVRPHGIRHQAITAALGRGHSVVDVMKFARHSSPNTTMIYDDNREDRAGMVARSISEGGD